MLNKTLKTHQNLSHQSMELLFDFEQDRLKKRYKKYVNEQKQKTRNYER